MITAKFVYSGDIITGFSVSGHSGSAEIGKDIICSAVSSASYMTVNTLTEIMLLNPEIIEKDGFLGIRLSKDEAAAVIWQGSFLDHLFECKIGRASCRERV